MPATAAASFQVRRQQRVKGGKREKREGERERAV